MNTEIATAVEMFLGNRAATESELVEKIDGTIHDRDLAERLIEFLPLAFGRVLLTKWGVTLPGYFVRMLDNGGFTPECPLDAEPLWKPAVAFARKAQTAMSKEEFYAIAARSAEVDAATKAMQAGSDPKNLVGATPILMREAPMPPSPPKKSWQFWK